jgi:hypothetical protein
MLRDLKTPNLGARIIAYSATTAASSTNTVQVGEFEGTYTNADNDEELDFVPRLPWRRAPVVIPTAGAGVGDGGIAHMSAVPTAIAIQVDTVDGAASSDVGNQQVLALGWDDSSPEAHGGRWSTQYGVKSTFAAPRMIVGQLDSTAAKNIGGNQYSVTDNGTGDHTITFDRPFGRVPVCVATPVTATDGHACRIESITATAVNVLTFNTANAAADVDFNFIVYGADIRDEHSFDHGRIIQVPFRKSRLLAFHISGGGTPVLTLGDEYGSVADDGAGEYTITYDEAFAREPVVVAGVFDASTDNWATIDASSTTAVGIEVANATGTLVDPSGIFVLVIGSDDATDY